MEARLTRRVLGVLVARLPESQLAKVDDPRGVRGRRWPLTVLLRTVLLALVAGCKSLAQAEALTREMSPSVRRRLGIGRRVADTTMRDLLCMLEPDELRHPLHALVRAAHRRKALEPDVLPFGVVAMDGKVTSLPSCDDHYAQRQSQRDGALLVGAVRTTTCTLISSRAMPCVDVLPIPATTNEMGQFAASVRRLADAYRGIDLFRMVTYDAGACSEHNGAVVRASGLHYLFGLKTSQPTLLNEAQRLLAPLPAEHAGAESDDVLGGRRTVLRRVYITEQMRGFDGWQHLCTVLRVESVTLDAKGHRTADDNRYFVEHARVQVDAQAMAAPRAPSLGGREQLPPHARHRVRGGRQALDSEQPARHARRRHPPAPRLHPADPLPLGHPALRCTTRHPLARPVALVLQRRHLRLGPRRVRAASTRARHATLTSPSLFDRSATARPHAAPGASPIAERPSRVAPTSTRTTRARHPSRCSPASNPGDPAGAARSCKIWTDQACVQ